MPDEIDLGADVDPGADRDGEVEFARDGGRARDIEVAEEAREWKGSSRRGRDLDREGDSEGGFEMPADDLESVVFTIEWTGRDVEQAGVGFEVGGATTDDGTE